MRNTARMISDAVAVGEKNSRTAVLVRNWCAHVRVERLGEGRGLVEKMTGLPVGHQSLACPHAPASGIAAWDLADAAIDFHDRNCATCTRRKPVGIPSIAQLIATRDRDQAERKKDTEQRASKRAKLLADRDDRRRALRLALPSVAGKRKPASTTLRRACADGW